MAKRYCVEVLGKMGFAFSQKEFDEHPDINMDGTNYKICRGDNDCIIFVPIEKFDVYDDKKGYWKKE